MFPSGEHTSSSAWPFAFKGLRISLAQSSRFKEASEIPSVPLRNEGRGESIRQGGVGGEQWRGRGRGEGGDNDRIGRGAQQRQS